MLHFRQLSLSCLYTWRRHLDALHHHIKKRLQGKLTCTLSLGGGGVTESAREHICPVVFTTIPIYPCPLLLICQHLTVGTHGVLTYFLSSSQQSLQEWIKAVVGFIDLSAEFMTQDASVKDGFFQSKSSNHKSFYFTVPEWTSVGFQFAAVCNQHKSQD